MTEIAKTVRWTEPGELVQVCALCGDRARFTQAPGLCRRAARCSACNGTLRNHDVARAILQTYAPGADALPRALDRLRPLKIFEAQASGQLHQALAALPGYRCAEFFDEVAPGRNNAAGIRCEDLGRLTFPDDSFDLVVTQDVLEHVPDPDAAFREISRVLTPSGYHIFSVPLHEGHRTAARRRRTTDGETDLLPPVYHADPLRAAGCLACTDFGDDLCELLRRRGLAAEIVVQTHFNGPDLIPWIADDNAYADYRRCTAGGTLEEMLRYFLYNSVVFRAGKAAG